VYPSNLSAACYETGDYSRSLKAIYRSWKLLSQETNSALALKLSVRAAKALVQGVRAESISSQALVDNAQMIDQLEVVARQQPDSDLSSVPEHIRVWEDWRKMESEVGDRTQAAFQARSRLSSLAVFKKPA
jgi:hypothetical protein